MERKKMFNLNFEFVLTIQLLPTIILVKHEGIFIVLPVFGTIIIS